MPYLAEVAALGTATCWAMGTILFGEASQRVGAFTTNTLRIPLATLFLAPALLLTRGAIWPTWADSEQVGLLALSALIGLVVGDSFYFRCVVLLGPRLAALFSTLAPPITAIAAWAILGEMLNQTAIFGMVVTLAGVVWAITEGKSGDGLRRRASIVGKMFGLGAAVSQGIGLVIAKLGMGQTVDALSATFIRILTATLGIWVLTAISGRVGLTLRALKNKQATIFMAGGVFIGPFLGIWLMLFSVLHTEAGVAATLMSTTPIIIIPLVMVIYREKTSARAWLGAAVAVAGIGLLFAR